MSRDTCHVARTLLKTLIAFDTTSRNSNLELIGFVQSFLKQHGIDSDLVYSSDASKANLFARIGVAGDGGIVLSGHTDVVPVDGQTWDTPPFILTEKDGKLYGRGTADMKSFLACTLALVPHWVKHPPAKPVYLALTYDEEVGCLGAPSLVQFLKECRITPELAIIGEPTMMKPVTAQKGIRSFATTVIGHEAHSSNPERGVNAVMIASELVHVLNVLATEYASSQCDDRFTPAYTTIHVGTIHGGTARNIIPRECSFSWEIRPLPNEDTDTIVARFEAKCRELEAIMKARYPETSITSRAISQVTGLNPATPSPLFNRTLHLLGTNSTEAVSYCTEAGIFQHAGFEAIILGPGDIAQAHSPNEFIDASQLDACVEFLEAVTSNSNR